MPRRRRPRVTWVFGATVDGRVAAPDGTSRWISSAAARADAHRLRAAHDAVLVGTGAARTDDPHLGLRHGVGGTPPLRVVLDAGARVVRASSRVVDEASPTLVVIGEQAPDPGLPSHVDVARVPLDERGRIALPALLDLLVARGAGTLLVEGGPTIAASFLEAGLVDEVVGYVRAAVLGAGRPLVDLPGVTTIGDLRTFRLVAADVVGDDVRMRMRVAPRRSAASQPAEERSRT